MNTKWNQYATTVAGGYGKGNELNQLCVPYAIDVDDDDQCIYIADTQNHRIMKWKYDAKCGEVVAGNNGYGNRINQLYYPSDMIVDKKNNCYIIADYGNRRVVRWSRQNDRVQQIIISDIVCLHLAMDQNGDLYVSDCDKNEVRRWKIEETKGTIVAGGNGKGNNLNQLNFPTSIFVDQDYSVYVSDRGNHRVMKWVKGAKEGIVVAGGQGQGYNLSQLSCPMGVIADHLGNVYVADSRNHRIMCWYEGSNEGSIVVGGNGHGEQQNRLNFLDGLSFDRDGNLYVVDQGNCRVQKFDIDFN